MSSVPAVFSFYGEGAGRLFTIYHDVTQACSNRPTHDPHVTHSTRVVGKRNWRRSYHSKTLPRVPVHRSGPGPTMLCAYVWPRPGGSCRCTKVGALLLTPLLMHGQLEPRPRPHWGSATGGGVTTVKLCHACPCTVLGLAQQCSALMCGPGPGAPVGVQK